MSDKPTIGSLSIAQKRLAELLGRLLARRWIKEQQAMNKRGDITEATPDVEERLRDKRAADDPTSKIRELDDDVNKRLAEKAAEALKTPTK